MFRQLPIVLSAQQALLSSLDRQLPSDVQQACAHLMSFRQLSSCLPVAESRAQTLPYEFFSQFWEVLGPELLAVLQEAFHAQHGLSLTSSMTQGVITLVYKGKGCKALLDSYRPITLLNSDYKLLAKALATRFGPALPHVVDPTHTAFVPGRWIDDSVLCHLEQVEYLQQTGQPGCMVF